MSSRALLFPGQGAQAVGMGKDLAQAFDVARDTYREADDILDSPLSQLCWEGPEDQLTRTRNAQPAILVHSVASLRVLHALLGDDASSLGIVAAAGHSLGEFSAHVAAGTLSFADGLRAVRTRGDLMYEAGLERPGTMAAVLGLDDERVREVCATISTDESVCVAANLNSKGQVVVSGDVDAVERAREALSEAGAKRVVPLNVSGAFHSPLMQSAREGLAAALADTAMTAPAFPVVSNVLAEPVDDPALARDLLVQQLTSAVRWAESVGTLVGLGVTEFIELGPGTVLAGLNRRNAKGTTTWSAGDPESMESLVAALTA